VSGRAQAAKVVAAALIEAILILGFVVLNMGFSDEGRIGVGPDRPPPPAINEPGARAASGS
jgi:hypothetical protein